MQPVPVIEQEFLPLRAKLLEIGAALDRLDRAGALGGREPRAGENSRRRSKLCSPAAAIARSRFSWFSAGLTKTIGGRDFGLTK